MTIDVSTILKELGGKIDINGDVEMSDTDFLGEMYHFNEPVKVSGSVSNNGKSLILKANCTGHMTTQCARCMKDIVVDIDFDIDENLLRTTAVYRQMMMLYCLRTLKLILMI